MRAIIVIAIAASLFAPLALAQDYEQHWRWCGGKEGATPDQSIRSCTIVIDARRENKVGMASAFHNRGVAYEKKGQWAQAIEQYNQAIRLNPPNPLSLAARGYAYVSTGQLDRGIADYDAAIAARPNFAFALNRRGVAYHFKRDFPRALQDFDAALRIDPSLVLAWTSRAATHGLMFNFEASLRDNEEANRRAPNDFAALSGICINAAILDRLEQAMPACEKALGLRLGDPATLYSRGLVHLKANRLDAAITDFSNALVVEQHAHMLYARAVARRRKGDTAGAEADFTSARFVMPGIDEEMARYGVK
jgi:tetratricopeptide (TPR) repeat protein